MDAQFAILGTGDSGNGKRLPVFVRHFPPVETGVQTMLPIAGGSYEMQITLAPGMARLDSRVFRTAGTPPSFSLVQAAYGWHLLGHGSPLGLHAVPARQFAGLVHAIVAAARTYAKIVDGVLDLWVVLPASDRAAERRIAQAACEMMRRYTDAQMDFMVIARDSPSVGDVIESDYTLVEAA